MINESSVASAKHISRALLATVIAFILIVCIFTANAFAGVTDEYNVVINDNGYKYTITTDETEPIEILNKANITLGSDDRVSIAEFQSGIGGTIVIDRLNTINIKLGEVIKTASVYADTVGEAFAEIGLNTQGCTVNYSDTSLIENGMVITVAAPKTIVIYADGKSYTVSALSGTVSELLNAAGITLGENDYTEPMADTAVTEDMVITVYRVEIKTVTVSETISYSTTTINDAELERGTSKIEVEGSNGKKSVEYQITYTDGVESSRKEISSTVVTEPVDEVKRVGTRPADVVANGVESYNGYTLSQTVSGRYTHYCACSICCGKSNGVTSSGKKVTNGMDDPYYVACNWLPLGSVIEIDGEIYTVVDRGGSGLSKSGRVDIYTPEGHSAAKKKGSGSCSITIIRFGW